MYTKHLAAKLLALTIILAIVFLPLYKPFAQQSTQTNTTTSSSTKSNQDKINDLEAERKKIQEERTANERNKQTDLQNKTDYQMQIINLRSDVADIELDIKDKELEIESLTYKIEILEKEIENLKQKIEDTKQQIKDLEEETDQRMVESYLAQKQMESSSSLIFSSDGLSGFIKGDTYRMAMQEDTNRKIKDLEDKRVQLELDQQKLIEDRTELDRSRNTIKDNKTTLERQKTNLQSQQALLDQKIKDIQSRINGYDELIATLSSKERDLMKQQEEIRKQMLLKNETTSGMKITRGTMLGIEGDTGYAFGKHLHFGVSENGAIQNPCSYLPAGAYGSCGGSGRVGIPLAGAVFTSGFRTLERPNHNAIDVSTGGGGSVVAAHDGYLYYFYEACPAWAQKNCNGPAIVAKVCEVDKCQGGISTVYYHLACTTEIGNSRSCKR